MGCEIGAWRRAVPLLAGLCCLILTAPVRPAGAPDAERRLLLEAWEAGLGRLDQALGDALWHTYTTGALGRLPACEAARLAYLNSPGLGDSLAAWRHRPYSDPSTARKAELMDRWVLDARLTAAAELVHLQDSLSQAQITYRARFEEREVDDRELAGILRHDRSRARRAAAFR
ncbi:MAG: hypothetical protein GF355_07955, partial [Candidatus Eisenbacteria bacterium]|nr:hypothetical protein [Candidatus Eisenbacteria bacterium]